MKKIIISLALSFFVVVGSYSQNIDKLITELAQERGADNVKVDGFLLSLAKPFISTKINDKETLAICNGVKSIQVIDISGSDETVRSNYVSKLNQIQDIDGYETLIRVKEKGEDVRIIMKCKKDKIKELYILSIDENDISAVKLTGNIKRKDIEKLAAKYDK